MVVYVVEKSFFITQTAMSIAEYVLCECGFGVNTYALAMNY